MREQPDGTWRAWVSLGRGADGKRVRLSKSGFRTKGDAQKWLREQLAEKEWGRGADAHKVTVGQWLDRWLSMKKGTVEHNTWHGYGDIVRIHLKPRIGAIPLAKLDTLTVRALYASWDEAGVGRPQQHRAATVLRSALKDACEADLIRKNPARQVKKPRASRPQMLCWDEPQARAFLCQSAGSKWGTFFALALDSGARPGELLALHWPDVDLAGRTINLRRSLCKDRDGCWRLKDTKTPRGRRRVSIAPQTAELLRQKRLAAPNGAGPVFPGHTEGRYADSHQIRHAFHEATAAAKLPRCRLYDLRHTSATILLGRGVNIRVISDRLGHETPEFTLRHYLHAMPAQQEQAALAISELFNGVFSGGTPAAQPAPTTVHSQATEPQPGSDFVI